MIKPLFSAVLLISFAAKATELDPQTVVPQEIVVREDTSGNREVFKVSQKQDVQNDDAALMVVENFVSEENKVANILPESELDRVSSTEAWYYWRANWYGYSWYGHNYYYRPYYSYYYGSYYYYYYRWY